MYIRSLICFPGQRQTLSLVGNMLAKSLLIVLTLTKVINGQKLNQNHKTIQFILDMEADLFCSGLVVVSDNFENNDRLDELIERYQRPLILLESHSNGIVSTYIPRQKIRQETYCKNVVLFISNLDVIPPVFHQVLERYHVRNFFIATRNISSRADILLREIRSESIWLLVESGPKLRIRRWFVNNIIQSIDISKYNDSVKQNLLTHQKLTGLHLTIGTLDFPPIVFAEKNRENTVETHGIEPSLMSIIAERLDFKFHYIFPDNTDEMWGTLIFNGDNFTITGILGLLHSKRADVAYGDLHIQERLVPYVDFTVAFRNNYECFLIPAPRPYAKWTALYHPFSPAIWTVTGFVSGCAVVTLWLLAKFSPRHPNKDSFFCDLMVCFLYILGTFLGVQQPEIRSHANRLFLVWWLLAAATIIPTLYRSGLISFITFPYTPPPLETIEQLVDSPFKKISWGEFFKTSLMNSTDQLQRKLGSQLAVATNLTNMFSLLETDSWAIMSNQGNLRYEIAAHYPPTTDGPRVHIMRECVFPTRSALGLQKHSSLKPYFDREIYRIVEVGLVEHITSLFAKKEDQWDPRANSGKLVSYSLDSLQGAFYLWALGIGISTFAFLAELIVNCQSKRRKKKNVSLTIAESRQ